MEKNETLDGILKCVNLPPDYANALAILEALEQAATEAKSRDHPASFQNTDADHCSRTCVAPHFNIQAPHPN